MLPPINSMSHAQSDASVKFQPDINISRKLLRQSITDRTDQVDPNPYKVTTKTSEGTLLTGECDRKIDRLEALKYKLI
jgi:hypothetical protein